MINIKIQVFSKDNVAGMHLELEPTKGKPDKEVELANWIVQIIHASLRLKMQISGSKANFIETTADSIVNDKLRKEFGLDEDRKNKQG